MATDATFNQNQKNPPYNMITHRSTPFPLCAPQISLCTLQAGIRDWRKFPAVMHVAIALFLVCGNVNASLLYEGFQYDGGPLLSGMANGGEGWGAPWSKNINCASDGASLNYPPALKIPTSGSRLSQIGSAMCLREISAEIQNAILDEGGVIYFSVLVSREASEKKSSFLTFTLLVPNPAQPILEFGLTSTNAYRLGLFGEQGVTRGTYTLGQTTLLVVKLNRVDGELKASLWSFGPDAEIPSVEPDPYLKTTGMMSIEGGKWFFRIEQGENCFSQVDEIRVLKDWNAVVAGGN